MMHASVLWWLSGNAVLFVILSTIKFRDSRLPITVTMLWVCVCVSIGYTMAVSLGYDTFTFRLLGSPKIPAYVIATVCAVVIISQWRRLPAQPVRMLLLLLIAEGAKRAPDRSMSGWQAT